MIVQKLPKTFMSNSLITKLAEIIQGKKILFSSLVYLLNGKTFIINKNQKTPYFEKDWQCYSLLRCYANTLITTGSIIRNQKNLFKTYFACGDKEIELMYNNFKQKQKQNVYVMTNTLSKEEVLSYFNVDIYNLIAHESLQKKIPNANNLNTILRALILLDKIPVLIECGTLVMNEYFSSIKNAEIQNSIEAGYIAYFEGDIHESSIGKELEFDSSLFEINWQSQQFPVEYAGHQIGKLYFKAYKRK